MINPVESRSAASPFVSDQIQTGELSVSDDSTESNPKGQAETLARDKADDRSSAALRISLQPNYNTICDYINAV